jgi:putative transposase
MQFIGRLYVRRFNYRYARSGTLFDGRFKSSLVQGDRYLLACMRYIELNPIRACLVTDPGDYRWSSYRCHAFGKKVRLWSPHALYTALGATPARRQASYRELIGDALTIEAIAKISHCANTGLVLGTDAFRKQIESMST